MSPSRCMTKLKYQKYIFLVDLPLQLYCILNSFYMITRITLDVFSFIHTYSTLSFISKFELNVNMTDFLLNLIDELEVVVSLVFDKITNTMS